VGNELKIFKKDLFEVALKLDNGEVLFDVESVSRCLGISRIASSGNEVVRWDRVNKYLESYPHVGTVGKGDFIPEPAVYKLAFKASNEVAEKFQDWLAVDVIPSIRKHGTYMTDDTLEKALASPDFLIQLATRLKEEKQKNTQLENEKKVLKPKAEYVDRVLNADGLFTATEIAKDFGLKSAYALNKILNGFKVIRNVNDKWCLYSDYCGKGYAKDKIIPIKRKDGTTKTVSELYWTEKGRKFLYDFLVMQGLIKEAV
jgi:prophage antirepressor-like protein